MNPSAWLGLTEEHLVACQHGHKLQRQACQAFQAMQAAAVKDGIDLQIVSAFRDYRRQLAIWEQKWSGQRALYDLQGKELTYATLSDEDKLHAILTWSALPGASRHHWGTDLDVFDQAQVEMQGAEFQLVSTEYQTGGPCHQLACWLEKHAENHGFFRPYAEYNGGVAPEAWHLSYAPLAEQIVRQLDLAELRRRLTQTDILGKPVILANLEAIFTRYTLNGQA